MIIRRSFAKAIGLDVKSWLEKEWIDLMSAGDYFKFELRNHDTPVTQNRST